MSLEQALQENTNTMKQLIAVLSTVAEDGGALAPAGDTTVAAEGGKRKRRTKAEIEAEAAAQAAASTATTATPGVTINTTGAPIYVIVDNNNTAAVIEPGHVIPSLPSLRQVSQAEYEAYKAQQAAASAAANPVATGAPAPDFKSLVDRLMKLHAAKGNEGVMAVLAPFKAASVPALEKCDLTQVAAKIAEVEVQFGLAQPAANNLFG